MISIHIVVRIATFALVFTCMLQLHYIVVYAIVLFWLPHAYVIYVYIYV